MSASQNNLSLVLNQQDSNGTNILNRNIGPIAYSGFVGQFSDAILTGTGAVTLTLPAGLTNVLQAYFKNTSSTGNITINGTPLSATGSVILAKLGPGAISVPLWTPVSGSSGGYSAFTGTADTTNCTLEYFLGG